MTHSYEITGMTCKGCVAKIKTELLKLSDVLNAEVQLESPQATITMQRHITTPALQAAIAKAGSFSITDAPVGTHQPMAEPAIEERSSYFPIFLIFGYILGVSLLIQLSQPVFHWQQCMNHVMAGFFLVFSFFKLMNLQGFKEGYSSYDILAKAIPAYGYVYPFIELSLGIAYLTGFNPPLTNTLTLIVMSISSIGVIQSLLRKTQFQCACLGTVIKLPLSKVTLVEDLAMVAMSAFMLLVP